MTDFRLVQSLHAYSGGTVPDSHRIHYSPLSLNASQRHLNAYEVINKILSFFPFVKRDSFHFYRLTLDNLCLQSYIGFKRKHEVAKYDPKSNDCLCPGGRLRCR